MLFQLHLKVNGSAVGLGDLEDAFLIAEDGVRDGERSGVLYDRGTPVGFWSITDTDEDPRVARVRQIAEGLLNNPEIPFYVATRLRPALLSAIDGNSQEVGDVAS